MKIDEEIFETDCFAFGTVFFILGWWGTEVFLMWKESSVEFWRIIAGGLCGLAAFCLAYVSSGVMFNIPWCAK